MRPYYGIKGLKVSSDGTFVSREYEHKNKFDTPTYHPMKIFKTGNGIPYIKTKDRDVQVDLLVATCFCYRPKDGYHKYIIHKDGDMSNCDKSNLEWVTEDVYRQHYKADRTYTDENGETWTWSTALFYASDKGNIKENDKLCKLTDLVSDPDLGCLRAIRPSVYSEYKRQRYCADEVVALAFCTKLPDIPEGCQAVLHIDNDMKNNDPKNLKWVDPNCDEYKKFMEVWKKEKEKTNLQYSTLP